MRGWPCRRGVGGAEDGQRRIVLELVDDVLVAVDAVNDVLEEGVELADDDLGRVFDGEGGRPDDVNDRTVTSGVLAPRVGFSSRALRAASEPT